MNMNARMTSMILVSSNNRPLITQLAY